MKYRRLELFALAPDDDLYLSTKSPVAAMDVSLSFSFSIPAHRAEDVYYRYVLSGTTAGGERVPLTVPIYPEIPTVGALSDIGFKGFHTDSAFAPTDLCPDFEVVDVYLDMLQGAQNGGILYAGSDRYYYFDEAYVTALDRRIKNLSSTGCRIYLRFLISPDANELAFADHTESTQGIVNKFISVQSEGGFYAVHAFTDFLTKRYSAATGAAISGIVLGRSADRPTTHNYNTSADLAAYAARYADTLHLISGVARTNVPDLRMIVPVSDAAGTPAAGDSTPTAFLHALLLALRGCSMSPAPLTVMLESGATPQRVTGAVDTTCYGIDRLDVFLDTLKGYRADYPFVDADILYAWQPANTLDTDQLRVAYTLQYLALYFNDAVHSFLTDLSLLESARAAEVTVALQYLVKEIDTDRNATALAPMLELLHISSFEELNSAYNMASLRQRKIVEVTATNGGYAGEHKILGSYRLWDFTVATGLMDWFAGNACTHLSVLSGNGTRALTARLAAPQSGEFGEIAYHFSPTSNLSYVPFMKYNIGIKGTEGTPYEVQIRLLCDTQTVTATAVLYAGDTEDLYIDLSGVAAGLSKVYSIRILARPLNGNTDVFQLHLHTVDVKSDKLTDSELFQLIQADRNLGAETEAPQEAGDYTKPLVITALILLFSLMAVVALSFRHKNEIKRREGNKTNDNGEG